MAWTQSDLDGLRAAYASGVLKVEHGDNKITYNSSAELLKAIQELEKTLNTERGPMLATYATDRGFR